MLKRAPVTVMEGNHQLKTMLGADFRLGDAITPEKIAACQHMVDQARQGFFEESEAQLIALETMAEAVNKDAAVMPAQVEQAETLAFNIKGQAALYGFGFISGICGRMVAVVTSRKLSNAKKAQAFVKLTHVLRMAYRHKITDEGAELGAHLLENWGLER